MRICYLGNAGHVHVRRWVSYFIQAGHEVHIVSHQDAELPGATVHVLPALFQDPEKYARAAKALGRLVGEMHSHRFLTFGASFPLGLARVRRLVRSIAPDVVHAHFITNYGLYGAWAGVHPLVMTPWGSDVFLVPDRFPLLGKLTGQVLRRADLITTDGDNTIERMVQLGADRDRIRKIHFGIDTREFHPGKRAAAEFRRRYGFPEDAVVVLSNRNLDPLYNVMLLVRAAPQVLAANPGVRFLIGGRGSQKEEIQAELARLGVADRAAFTGFLAAEDFSRVVASADIYVSTSTADSGLAASTGEAMACGLPVLITETGASKDWVQPGRNGRIIPMDDPRPLADAILELAADPAKREAWGQANRALICERQDYHREMGRMEQLMLELVERQAARKQAR